MGETFFQVGMRFLRDRLKLLCHGDIGKGNDHTVDPVGTVLPNLEDTTLPK